MILILNKGKNTPQAHFPVYEVPDSLYNGSINNETHRRLTMTLTLKIQDVQVRRVDDRLIRRMQEIGAPYSMTSQARKDKETKGRMYMSVHDLPRHHFYDEDDAFKAERKFLLKEYRRLMPEIIERIMAIETDQFGEPRFNKDVKMGFNQKAGCSCGCSPGFVVRDESCKGYSIWVDLVASDE
jgi:hypothetical protein